MLKITSATNEKEQNEEAAETNDIFFTVEIGRPLIINYDFYVFWRAV